MNNEVSVSITTGDNPKDAVIKGINNLGGISKFIEKDETVFIKINLTSITGFPSNVNFNTLIEIIKLCKTAGAKKVYIGSFPYENLSIKDVSDELGLKEFLEYYGGELVFLDNSDKLKISNEEKLKLQKDSFKEVEVQDFIIQYPKIILNIDKFICLNQVNVHPLFNIHLSLLNLFSCIPFKFRKIFAKENAEKDYIITDQYKKKLISRIFDIYDIKKPNLVINDLFHFMEGAGPFIYKDSKINPSKYIVCGNEAIATDYTTLKILGLNPEKNFLISHWIEKNIGILDLEKINLLGENLEEINLTFKQCKKRIEDIYVQKFNIKKGQICSGCFLQSYYLLNFLKTFLLKDLNYLPQCSYLFGANPLEPDSPNNIILYGDCAIKTTEKREFRTIEKEGRDIKTLFLKKAIMEKKNKRILEIPGCPPNIQDTLNRFLKYFKKNNLPTLNFYMKKLNKTKKTVEFDES